MPPFGVVGWYCNFSRTVFPVLAFTPYTADTIEPARATGPATRAHRIWEGWRAG